MTSRNAPQGGAKRFAWLFHLLVLTTGGLAFPRPAVAQTTTCPVSTYSWDLIPNPQCQNLPSLPPLGSTIAVFFGSQRGKGALGELALNQCTFDLMYGPDRERFFKLSFVNGIVMRQGQPFSSSYYTDNGAQKCWDKNTLTWYQKAQTLFSDQPVGFPRTIYVVDLNSNFYAVDICEDESVRALIDTPPTDVAQAVQNCTQAGYSGVGSRLQNLQVVHSAILGTTVDQVTSTSTHTGGTTRTMLVSGNVLGAGIMMVNAGKVTLIGNCSGHFKPPLQVLEANIEQLEKANVTAGPLVDNVYYSIPALGCTIAFFTIADPGTTALYNDTRNYAFPVTPGVSRNDAGLRTGQQQVLPSKPKRRESPPKQPKSKPPANPKE